MTAIRIVLVDPYPLFREGLRHLLQSDPEFVVVGETGSATEALRLVRDTGPDILLFDLTLAEGSGLSLLRDLHVDGSHVRSLLLTTAVERQDMAQALLWGLRGLVLKHAAKELLFKGIRCVMAGQYWLGHDRLADLVESLRDLSRTTAARPQNTLTRREFAIVAAIVDGSSNRDISTQLGLSEQTVKNHLSHIFDKVGVSNRLELALFAIHHKLVNPAS